MQAVRASSAMVRGVGGASQMPERDYRLWAWMYATSYGLLIELLQAMLPWRSADLMDAAVNAIGAALGVLIGQKYLSGKNHDAAA